MTELHESIQGCGNHSCIIRKPSGQGTNGGCTCIDRHMNTKEVRDVKAFIHWQKDRIADLKAKLSRKSMALADTEALLMGTEERLKKLRKILPIIEEIESDPDADGVFGIRDVASYVKSKLGLDSDATAQRNKKKD